jgi:hypothetical protein
MANCPATTLMARKFTRVGEASTTRVNFPDVNVKSGKLTGSGLRCP